MPQSNNLEDQVFWYKADPHAEFKIGAAEFWKHHNANFNDGFDSDDDNQNFVAPKRKVQ